MGAYPTTLIFSQSLSGHIYLPALYLVTFGVGEILSTFKHFWPKLSQKKTWNLTVSVGILISIAANRIKNFAQLSSLIVGKLMIIKHHHNEIIM